jgi:membrane-anchored glycerophosphoryl diester phosphodiesterase (GDPDase)
MLVAFIVVAAYLSLAIPGIVMNNRPIFRAIRESIKLVIKNLMTTLNLLVIVFLIAIGTNLLWHLPEDGSWFTFVGIFGHAFISTALAIAIFSYYRDRYSFFIGNELRVAE